VFLPGLLILSGLVYNSKWVFKEMRMKTRSKPEKLRYISHLKAPIRRITTHSCCDSDASEALWLSNICLGFGFSASVLHRGAPQYEIRTGLGEVSV
jgi:hypothetical protein